MSKMVSYKMDPMGILFFVAVKKKLQLFFLLANVPESIANVKFGNLSTSTMIQTMD